MKYRIIVAVCCMISVCACRPDPSLILPELNFKLADSTIVANTKNIPYAGPIVLIHFEESCRDCQQMTDSLMMSMNELKNIRFYFFTMDNFHDLDKYAKHFHLDQYSNITVGQDYEHKMIQHFKEHGTPLMALYGSDKLLVGTFVGKTDNKTLITSLKTLD